jgi:hypothetical protein
MALYRMQKVAETSLKGGMLKHPECVTKYLIIMGLSGNKHHPKAKKYIEGKQSCVKD